LYLNIYSSDADIQSPSRLKPICPTRWLTQLPTVVSVLSNYASILKALEKAAAEFGTNTGTRANNLRFLFESGKTLLGLLAVKPILQCMEAFNRGLQGSTVPVSGMLQVASVTRCVLLSLRIEDSFSEIFDAAQNGINDYELTAIVLPRNRKIPKRLDDGFAANTIHTTSRDFYGVQFFKAIDSAVMDLDTISWPHWKHECVNC
jgi:hypothetical protein